MPELKCTYLLTYLLTYYSKYPELCKFDTRTASSLVVQYKSVFARRGIPRDIISDNMSFNSSTFKALLSEWGIVGMTSTPVRGSRNYMARVSVS